MRRQAVKGKVVSTELLHQVYPALLRQQPLRVLVLSLALSTTERYMPGNTCNH